jgi:formiminotetrahydrofolate cyclodeaminase
MYIDNPLHFFLDKLCSKSPEPGGGSASALVGATAASLSGMLAALTVDKKGYEDVKSEMEGILAKASSLKDELLDLLQKDTEAFEDASKAFKMPRDTEEQKQQRATAIEEGLKKATAVPFAIMEKSLEVSRLARRVVKSGNEMAITDGAISALLAEMKDRGYVEKTEKRLGEILDEVKKIKEEAGDYTLKKLQT